MSTVMRPKNSSNRTELLQGTLDMLILRTLLFGRLMAIRLQNTFQRTMRTCW